MIEESQKVLVFIPTYNENGNIEQLTSRLLSLPLELDLLFLDDHSPDGTGEILDRLAASHRNINVIHRANKLGVGSAHYDGILWAYDHGYSTLVTMDADFTHSPEMIPEMLNEKAKHPEAHLVLASRFLSKGSLPEWTLWRKFLTHFGHLLTRICLRMDYDATGAFRLYRLNKIPKTTFAAVDSKGYAFFYESLFLFDRNGYTIREIPVDLQARQSGHSKLTIQEIGRSLSSLFSILLLSLLNPKKFKIDPPRTD